MKTLFPKKPFSLAGFFLVAAGLVSCLAAVVVGADPVIRPDLPNRVAFPLQQAKYVRFAIDASSSSQPCLDELEVYGVDEKLNLAATERGAVASASSCLPGYRKHTIEHLKAQKGHPQSELFENSCQEVSRRYFPP